MLESNALASRPPSTRSRITNRSGTLRGIDGRSAEARRYRDLVEGFAANFGAAPPGERETALIRQAAAVAVEAEAMQAAIVRGEDVDPDHLVRLTNILSRALKELGLKKRRRQQPSLADYLGKQTGAAT